LYIDDNIKNFSKSNILSKEISILVNNWFVMYFLSVVLIGTVYPIFLEVISNTKISVGPPFYHKLILPFLILFLLFMSIGPKLNWIKTKVEVKKFNFFILFIISLALSFFIFKLAGPISLTNTILLAASAYLFCITIKDFFSKSLSNYPQKISHFGFSLLILSILLNSIFSTEVIANLKVGEKFLFKGGSITFDSIKNKKHSNYHSITGNFIIKDEKTEKIILNPELRIYNQPITMTSEADIRTTLYSDKFIVMNLVKGNEYFNVRYQIKSFMIWIWIAVLLMITGAIFSFFRGNYEK
tara:strand:- start:1968 stop:2861 length:894 start_codon:yes stop_codon:yes gene_type:complete